MSAMVERVARAICRLEFMGHGDPEAYWQVWEEVAEVAIAAMKIEEPAGAFEEWLNRYVDEALE